MRKSRMIVAFLIALMMVFTVVLSACKHTHEFSKEWSSDATNHWHKATCEHTNEVADKAPHDWASNGKCKVCGRDKSQQGLDDPNADTFMELGDYKAYIKAELGDYKALFDSLNTNAEVSAAVTAAYDAGITAIGAATSVSTVQLALNQAKTAMAQCVPLADGIFDYTGYTVEQRTEILGLLEAYGYRTGLTGISMFENGGYVMYNPRITLGTENYIPGYGFGTLTEGSIKSDLDSENNPAWKRYYHTYDSKDPGTANFLDAQDSQVSSYFGYIGASYYTVVMNDTKDGYVWIPELAASEVEPVGELNEANQTDTWRFKIRTDLRYSTLGTRSSYNNRLVQPQDFITPFKLLLNQANNLYRGNELANQTGEFSIVGAKEYYQATEKASKGVNTDQSFDKVGVRVYEDEEESGTWWFEYQLGAKVNAWYARYDISSSLYMPIPEEFIEEVGVDNYLGFESSGTSILSTPVDNSLSLGAYVFEAWNSDQNIVYKKNTNYVLSKEYYAIAGVHINILEAVQNDENAAFREFLEGNLDSCGIPSDYLAEYVYDERTHTTTGDTTLKLNYNALSQEMWIKLFGENGTISQTPESDYWQTKPVMTNAHFRQALSYAFNRIEFAAAKGRVASVNFLSSAYLSDPENGVAYNLTEAHEKALGNLINDMTDEAGYSLELARDYFRMALDELEASGAYTRGTKANPTEIKLEIAWWTPAYENAYHKYAKQYWEGAFNDDSVHGGCYKLTLEFWCSPKSDPNDAYDRIEAGTFDLAFGAIEGVTQNPLGLMNILSTDQSISHGFTLNLAVDTNDPNADLLIFEGKRFSYDALYQATQQPVQVSKGALGEAFVGVGDGEFELDPSTGKVTATLSYIVQDGVEINDYDFIIFGYDWGFEYYQFSIKKYIKGGAAVSGKVTTYTIEIPAEEFAKFYLVYGVDLYVSYSIPAAHIGPTQMDPDNEIGYIDGWDILFAAPTDMDYAIDDDGTVTASFTLALLMDGVEKESIAFVLYGYYGAEYDYDEVDLVVKSIKENDDGTFTYTIEIAAEYLDGLVDVPGIDVYVALDSEGEYPVYLGVSLELVLAGLVDADVDFDEDDGSATVELTVEILEGLTEDNFVFVLRGYTEDDYVEIDLSDYLEDVIDNEDGTLTFVFVIPEEIYGVLCGDVVGEGEKAEDLSEYQGIDVYLVLGEEEAEIFVDSLDYVFVEAVEEDVESPAD